MTGDDSEDDSSNGSPDAISSIYNTQKKIEDATGPEFWQAIRKADESRRSAYKSLYASEFLQKQARAQNAVKAAAPVLFQSQKLVNAAVKSGALDELVELNDSLNTALQNLASESINADLVEISTTRRSHTRQAPAFPTHKDETTPAEDLHDQLVWDDGEWYREKATETAVTVVDYSFWKAKQGGELTDATEKEISTGAAAMALIVTGILTGNLLLAIPVAAGTGALTEMGQQGAQDRSERKDLDEKFDEE